MFMRAFIILKCEIVNLLKQLEFCLVRAGLKGKGSRGNFHLMASTSSFVKFMFSLIRKVFVCFFR